MDNLYVVGGKQRGLRPLTGGMINWNGYEKGLVVQLDSVTGTTTTRAEYSSVPEGCGSVDGAVLYQAGTLEGDKLYLCTQTEILIYSLPNFVQIYHLSLPIFNDLHHVRPTPEGNLLVANAGLQMVLEVSMDGEILRAWNVMGGDPWADVSKDKDYRGLDTKPHVSHPNYVFYVGDEIWTTRFHQGDAICLTEPGKRIQVSTELIHDGVVHDDRVYFTSVPGKVIVANPHTLQVEEEIDVNSMHPEGDLLGWCRGILIDGDNMWLGFSRVRPTRFRENVGWVMRGFKRSLPTHVACYDLKKRRCLADFDMEPAGLGAIFSLFPVVKEPAKEPEKLERNVSK